jgi:hypothetical protein
MSKEILEKDTYSGEKGDSAGCKKCLQRKVLITKLGTCLEGSIRQDPSFVSRDAQAPVSLCLHI